MLRNWTFRKPLASVFAGLTFALTACAHAEAPVAEACNQAAVTTYKANSFAVDGPDKPADMAAALVRCLGDPDPVIRDQIAYEGLTGLLRGQSLTPDEMRVVMADLLAALEAPDPDGFRAPFAALMLSEIVRTDRAAPWQTPDERQQLLSAATDYVSSVDDYRGFEAVEGWRHGVAHGADWLMQIALNPAYQRDDHLAVLAAIRPKIMVSEHAYIRGEGERLARPILFIYHAGTLTADDWTTWFASIADPSPLDAWGDVFASEPGLNRLHNLKAVLFALALQTPREGEDMLPGLIETIRLLP